VSHLLDRPLDRPRIIGHRGCAANDVVENTLPAMRRAAALGAEGIELDVRLTSDGVPVVLHDEDFVRVGGPARKVAEMNAADVAMVLLRGDATTPRLDDVLAWTTAHQVLTNIEIKLAADASDRVVERMVDAVRAAIGDGPARDVALVSSFHVGALRRWIATAPEIPVALLARTSGALATWRTLDGCAALHPAAALLTPALVAECRSRGQRLHVWTLNDPTALRVAFDAGVDGVITDDPATAANVRDTVRASE
jgi:glycerophosphoryl diester phosphodiesterase